MICDQSFLFLGYAEHYNDASYPLLRDMVQCKGEWATHDEESRRNAELVENQGLIPTVGLWWEYQRLLQREKQTWQAIERRQKHLERFKSDFSEEMILTEKDVHGGGADGECGQDAALAQSLLQLFLAFAAALNEYGYKYGYSDLLQEMGTDEKNKCLMRFHAVLRWCRSEQRKYPCQALVFWALFTKETRKLLKGGLKKFEFSPPLFASGSFFPLQNRSERSVQLRYLREEYGGWGRSSGGIDSLSDRALPDEHRRMAEQNAKQTGQRGSQLLGHAAATRCHTDADESAADRSHPLVHGGEKNEEKVRDMICRYQRAGRKLREVLQTMIEENNLHFGEAHAFTGQEKMQDPHLVQCECMLLEFALKEKVFVEYYRNLFAKAKELFPSEWFASETVFDMEE